MQPAPQNKVLKGGVWRMANPSARTGQKMTVRACGKAAVLNWQRPSLSVFVRKSRIVFVACTC